MRQQTEEFEQGRKQQASRTRTVHRRAEELGLPAELLGDATPEALQALEALDSARRGNKPEQSPSL
jgi:hypothetical protein